MGHVLKIQSFCLNDGPGIRTTVFLQGCNLRCFWCHNPESQPMKPVPLFNGALCIGCGACGEVCPSPVDGRCGILTDNCIRCGKCCQVCFSGALEMSSKEMTPQELFKPLVRQKTLFEESGGGVTFSGGEPLMQADFLEQMLRLCKGAGIHTTVDTALHVDQALVERLLPYADLWLCDMKAIHSDTHKRGVGVGNEKILSNIRWLNSQHADMILRMPIIPGFNDSDQDMQDVCAYIHSLTYMPPVNLLPFHNWCENKYALMGKDFQAKDITPPTDEHMNHLKDIFIQSGIHTVKING